MSFKLEGEQNFPGASSQDGSYAVNGTIAGFYQFRPPKSDQSSSISPYDVALVLQHAIGLRTLSGGALTAADINKNGSVNSTDV